MIIDCHAHLVPQSWFHPKSPKWMFDLPHLFDEQDKSGVEITVVQRLLGHSHLSTTSTYLHVRQERLAQIAGPLHLLDLSQLPPAS